MSDVTVRDNPAKLRYEALRDGRLLGEIRSRTEPRARRPRAHRRRPLGRRQRVGSELVAGALDDIRSRGLRVVLLCPFVAAYIRRHPEYAALVTQDPATPD